MLQVELTRAGRADFVLPQAAEDRRSADDADSQVSIAALEDLERDQAKRSSAGTDDGDDDDGDSDAEDQCRVGKDESDAEEEGPEDAEQPDSSACPLGIELQCGGAPSPPTPPQGENLAAAKSPPSPPAGAPAPLPAESPQWDGGAAAPRGEDGGPASPPEPPSPPPSLSPVGESPLDPLRASTGGPAGAGARRRRRQREAGPSRFGPLPLLSPVDLGIDVIFTAAGGAEYYGVRGPHAALEFLRGCGRTGGLTVSVLDPDTRSVVPSGPDEAAFIAVAHPVDGIRHSPALRALAAAFRAPAQGPEAEQAAAGSGKPRGPSSPQGINSPTRSNRGDALWRYDRPWLRFLAGGGVVWLDERFQVLSLAAFGTPLSEDATDTSLRVSREFAQPPDGAPPTAPPPAPVAPGSRLQPSVDAPASAGAVSPRTALSAAEELARQDTIAWLLAASEGDAERDSDAQTPTTQQYLHFAGPHPLPRFVREALLTESGLRLRQPTPLTPRPAPRRGGMRYYAWLPPRMAVLGRPCRYGGLAFLFDDPARDCFWTLVPPQQVHRGGGGDWARQALAGIVASQQSAPLVILLHSVAWDRHDHHHQHHPESNVMHTSVRMQGLPRPGTTRAGDGPGDHPAPAAVKWPVCWGCDQPVWNTARELGCAATEAESLRIELLSHGEGKRDEARVVAACDVPMDLLSWEEPYAAQLEAGDTGHFARVTLLPIVTPPAVKRVFFVRHGQSVWNKAQAQRNVVTMMSATDHPLNEEGAAQALALQRKVRHAREQMRHRHLGGGGGRGSPTTQLEDTPEEAPPAEEFMLRAQVVVSSPLTRAIQTALLSMQPVLRHRGRLVLCRNLRERRNFGGRDSSGSACGADIMERVRQHTAKLCDGDSRELESYMAVAFDTTEVVTKWWDDRKEDDDAFHARLEEFMTQLRYLPEERVIAVGHSHFFRSLFRAKLDSSAQCVNTNAADLCKKKLNNCGVAAVTLDFRRASPIAAVELLFDTQMVQ
eukprot:TRINITY_DN7721_c0_g1_i2.p1 TRINITY_DN7721_c0_g1~~TRINITY_DN7721_c0_g1_i2.p1  ORF type:complete len:1072 (+),score=319.57 TRINITY_DN7721_c0_g1_i2:220-3216(+)